MREVLAGDYNAEEDLLPMGGRNDVFLREYYLESCEIIADGGTIQKKGQMYLSAYQLDNDH
jgi:hypothetical protein